MKEKIEKDLDIMDREVVGLATRVQEDYEDILCEILPSDYEYSLKNGDDVKRLRNHLRKMVPTITKQLQRRFQCLKRGNDLQTSRPMAAWNITISCQMKVFQPQLRKTLKMIDRQALFKKNQKLKKFKKL